MKFTTAIFSLAFHGYAQAQNEQDQNQEIGWQEPERSLWQQSNMLNQVLTTTFPEWRDGWDFLYRYGCYCHQAELKVPTSRNGYHGPPLDELDSLCRDSFRAQKCLQEEYAREFSMDDKGSRNYPWYVDENTNQIVCNNKAKPIWKDREWNQFRLKNCLIEKEFVDNVVALIQNGYQKNEDWHKMGNWRYNKACAAPGAVLPPANNECCGTGLTRKPFNNAVKQCCNEEIVDMGSC